MEGLTLQVYNWLTELDEHDAATFLRECRLESLYYDTFFELAGEGVTHMYDVLVYVPLKIYKVLGEYSETTSKIEEAIRDTGQSDSIHVRHVQWRGRQKSEDEMINENRGIKITEILNETYVRKQIDLMNQSITLNPHLSIGLAKELIETFCKEILSKNGIKAEKDWDILRLVKETNRVIEVLPFDIPDKEIARKSIAMLLSGMSQIVHGITELRNLYGSGHGHDPKFETIDQMYVKLVVALAGEMAIFYLTLLKIKP